MIRNQIFFARKNTVYYPLIEWRGEEARWFRPRWSLKTDSRVRQIRSGFRLSVADRRQRRAQSGKGKKRSSRQLERHGPGEYNRGRGG